MLKVGLTGGLACGKSTIAEMFARRGVHVLSADRLAHELMFPGKPVYYEVVQTFGPGVVGPGGEIDRGLLANAAFGGGRIEELNRIVHPAVIKAQDEWMDEIGRREPNAIVMIEAALIIEAGAASHFDKLVVIVCSPYTRVARLAERMHTNPESARAEVERRMKFQLPDEKKVEAADYVIRNDGTLDEAEQQVEQVWGELKKLVG